MVEETKKRGYLSNFSNYHDWFVSHDAKWQKQHMFTCEHCGKKFIPNAPNQRFCGPDNKSCYKERHDSNLVNGQWVNKISADVLIPYCEKKQTLF